MTADDLFRAIVEPKVKPKKFKQALPVAMVNDCLRYGESRNSMEAAIAKLGEAAVIHFLHLAGLRIDYDPQKKQNLKVCDTWVGVRSTRDEQNKNNLIINIEDLEADLVNDMLPEYFFGAKVGWYEGKYLGHVWIMGYATLRDVCVPELIGKVRDFTCAGTLPGTEFKRGPSAIIQRDGFLVKFAQLRTDWEGLISTLKV